MPGFAHELRAFLVVEDHSTQQRKSRFIEEAQRYAVTRGIAWQRSLY